MPERDITLVQLVAAVRVILTSASLPASHHHAHQVVAFSSHGSFALLAMLIPCKRLLHPSELAAILLPLILSVLPGQERPGALTAPTVGDLLAHPAQFLNGLSRLLMNQHGAAVWVTIVVVLILIYLVQMNEWPTAASLRLTIVLQVDRADIHMR